MQDFFGKIPIQESVAATQSEKQGVHFVKGMALYLKIRPVISQNGS